MSLKNSSSRVPRNTGNNRAQNRVPNRPVNQSAQRANAGSANPLPTRDATAISREASEGPQPNSESFDAMIGGFSEWADSPAEASAPTQPEQPGLLRRVRTGITDSVRAGAGFVGDVVRGAGDLTGNVVEGVSDLAGDAGEFVIDSAGRLAGGLAEAAGADGLADHIRDGSQIAGDLFDDGLDQRGELVGDFTRGFTEGAAGAVEGVAELAVNPVGVAQGVREIIRDPSLLLDSYREIAAEHGAAGAVGAVAFDVLGLFAGGAGVAGRGASAARTAASAAGGAARTALQAPRALRGADEAIQQVQARRDQATLRENVEQSLRDNPGQVPEEVAVAQQGLAPRDTASPLERLSPDQRTLADQLPDIERSILEAGDDPAALADAIGSFRTGNRELIEIVDGEALPRATELPDGFETRAQGLPEVYEFLEQGVRNGTIRGAGRVRRLLETTLRNGDLQRRASIVEPSTGVTQNLFRSFSETADTRGQLGVEGSGLVGSSLSLPPTRPTQSRIIQDSALDQRFNVSNQGVEVGVRRGEPLLAVDTAPQFGQPGGAIEFVPLQRLNFDEANLSRLQTIRASTDVERLVDEFGARQLDGLLGNNAGRALVRNLARLRGIEITPDDLAEAAQTIHQ